MVTLVRRLAAVPLLPAILFPCAAFSQSVELSVWTQLTTASQSAVIERHVNECLADMPDVSVHFETVSIASMYQRVITAFQGGKLPNVMNTIEGMVGFLEAKNGLVPLDDVIDELGRDDFRPAYLNAVAKDGQVWGIPDWALHQSVWYRTDLFEEAGLDVPRTWDELMSAATTLNRDTDNDGNIDFYGMAVPMSRGSGVAAQTYFQFLYSAGGSVFDPETGEYAFGRDRDIAIAALNFMIDLHKAASPPASIEWGHGDFRTSYVEGKVAMTNEWGAVVLMAVEQNPEMLENMGVFPFPGPTGKAPASLNGGYYYIVSQGPEAEVTASKKLVHCMYDVDRVAQRANSRPVFAIPSTQSAFDSDTYRNNEVVKQFRPQLEIIFNEVMDNWYRYGMEAGLTPLAGQIEATTFIGDAIQSATLGRISVETAIDRIDAQLRIQISLLGLDEN